MLKLSFVLYGGVNMTNRDTQTVLQPVLINRLDSKIQYLNQLELAINNNQVSKVYELLDSQKFNEQIRQREHADSNAHLSVLVSDLQNDIASFLAPELIDYLTSQFDFLTFNPVQDEPTLYDVYIGDWWNHRQLGVLDILSASLTLDNHLISELTATAKLPDGGTLDDIKIQEINKIIDGLEGFLSDNTKRSLELRVIEDQLAELISNKAGLFGRGDKLTKQSLEKKRELLLATQKRVPEVQNKLDEQQKELLKLEKIDVLRQLELQAIFTTFTDLTSFIAALDQIYVSYIHALQQKN